MANVKHEQTQKNTTGTHPVQRLVMRFHYMFDTCDSIRISTPLDTMFLIIGFKRHTKDVPGQWLKNGEPFDFEYIEEKCIASGNTEAELISSAIEYKRLCNMTIEEYIKSLVA